MMNSERFQRLYNRLQPQAVVHRAIMQAGTLFADDELAIQWAVQHKNGVSAEAFNILFLTRRVEALEARVAALEAKT